MDLFVRMNRTTNHSLAGNVLVYSTVMLVALVGVISLAVDWGRVQLAKTELQAAADAAARYGVTGLSSGVNTVQSRVAAAAAQNKADGVAVEIENSDIEFGVWDPLLKEFTVLTGSQRNGATAIRVTARRTAARGNAIPLIWGAVIGRRTIDVSAVSVVARGRSSVVTIDADSSPWLAGMPNGSKVVKYDENTQDSVAPYQSPKLVTTLTLEPGAKISFRQVSGTTSWSNSNGAFGPDGDTSWIVRQRPANGINATSAPIQCMVGVFLDDRAPNTYAQPAELDYSTASSRNQTTYSPQLKQVFFIGDGLTSNNTLQQFVVPAGATRLYLGMMDEKGWWWDNYGTVSTMVVDDTITTVK